MKAEQCDARRVNPRATDGQSRTKVRLPDSPRRRASLQGSPRVHPPGRFLLLLLLSTTALFLLAACSGGGGAALSSVTASTNSIVPGSQGIGKPPGVVEVRYTLGSRQQVAVRLQGQQVNADLFTDQQDAGEHVVRFNGVISSTEPYDGGTLVRRVVPSGDYMITVTVGDNSQSMPLKVSGNQAKPPTIANLVVKPDTISPNADAVDDVAEVTFRTDQTATLSVDLTDAHGKSTQVLAPFEKGAGEQSVIVNGQDELGNTLPDGIYTATVRVEDQAGDRVEAQRRLTVQGGGEPSISILKVDIQPQQIILGKAITVSITVKNTGNVPLRTQGPDPGYTYTTNDSYSSIEGGKWVDRAGLWRAGVDWDGNSGGGGAYRYPFRWGFGHTLMPGETITTGGSIVILKQERTMWFYAGVLQEGIRIVLDRLGRTAVKVDF